MWGFRFVFDLCNVEIYLIYLQLLLIFRFDLWLDRFHYCNLLAFQAVIADIPLCPCQII